MKRKRGVAKSVHAGADGHFFLHSGRVNYGVHTLPSHRPTEAWLFPPESGPFFRFLKNGIRWFEGR